MIDNPIFADEVRIFVSAFKTQTYPEAKIWIWRKALGSVTLEITTQGSNEHAVACIELDKSQLKALVDALCDTL
jgi:hypothetical protein